MTGLYRESSDDPEKRFLPELEYITKMIHDDKMFDLIKTDPWRKTVFVWWWNEFLPKLAMDQHWGFKIRNNHVFTDKFTIKGRDGVDFPNKIYVTITLEAFACIMYDNWRTAWMNQFTYKANNPGKPIPKTKKDGKSYNAKYSMPRSGSKNFGGWSEEGQEKFKSLLNSILAFRKTPVVVDGKYPNFVKELIREANKEELDAAAAKVNKGRAAGPKPVPVAFAFIDE